MVFIGPKPGSGSRLVDEGAYPITVTNVKINDKEPDQYNEEAYQEYEFDLVAAIPDEGDLRCKYWCKVAGYNDKANWVKFGRALGIANEKLAKGTDSSDWIGASCQAALVQTDRGMKVTNNFMKLANKTRAPKLPATGTTVGPKAPRFDDDESDIPF